MNSVLQQLFMMPGLRKNLCSATLPSSLRSFGSGVIAKGSNLIGKKISVHWESGVSYDAFVEGFNESTGMHIIRYCPPTISGMGPAAIAAGGMGHHQSHHQQQIRPEDISFLPDEMPEEFFLSEGRPGKETGVFDVLPSTTGGGMEEASLDDHRGAMSTAGESSREGNSQSKGGGGLDTCDITETEDEASSRRLLEEIQRTFVHLEEGSRGRCFDPRSLVEASGCLKLEFDVWQQNDASEFSMKLLDRLEVSLKRWAPRNFKFLTHTFGLKQTKQKICKECGLKTNREENLMNIDCQIRGKADIHEALSTMCEVEFMEGDNKVFCDRCKKKCDTVLRTAISALPDVLILSLKRFDLDFTTFETVKLNSRCAFDQTLNMKRYTLEGVEAMEKSNVGVITPDGDVMDTCEEGVEYPLEDPLSSLRDEDYEYKLVGVLVHAGVAQGGHYYSFIKDRSISQGEDTEKWYRFDDEDVTPFDPSSIEVECFGGKVKKETKWPNGTVHTVESEQFANALMLFYEKVKPVSMEAEENWPMDEQESKGGQDVPSASGYDVFQPDVRRSNTTHCWHTFLFDAEFQSFLKGLLGLCLVPTGSNSDNERMEISTPSASPLSVTTTESSPLWHLAVLQMSLSFVFDILFHSTERDILNDWVEKLSAALISDKVGAKWFVHELARRCFQTSGNWLRVYCTDCPEEFSRCAAIQIMTTAIQSCIGFQEEQDALQAWAKAWQAQSEAHHRLTASKRQHVGALPTKLESSWKTHEDVKGFAGGSSSSIGIIISTLASLLEVAPRTRYNVGLSIFIRDVAGLDLGLGSQVLRDAFTQAQIPARLICLATRERAPPLLRAAFPGSSVSYEIAEALIKNETPPSSHLLPLAGGSVCMAGAGAGTTAANTTMPSTIDHMNQLEALGCIIGIPGVKRAVLVCESDTSSKGRHVISLSKEAKKALSIIFNESKSSEEGMGQRDIQNYMQRCGVDTSTVPPQKIASILNKYPTTTTVASDGGKESRYLSLEGFLAYYGDTAQTNEAQVRADLHTFGFRQDLTRRPEETRWYTPTGHSSRQHLLQAVESVALDIDLLRKGKQQPNPGAYAEHGLLCFHLHSLAYSACEPLAEYLLATAAHGRETNRLLTEALKTLSRAPTGWAGTETFNACLMVFKVLVSVPDQRQLIRIETLMKSKDKALPHAEAGIGLMVAAKDLSTTRTSQHYSTDFHYTAVERYINAVKELSKLQKVHEWMSKNRDLWSWMEHWLRSDGLNQQVRGDISVRREGAIHPPPAPNHHSDSDMNPGMGNDSEEDDDSNYDQVENYPGRGKVIAQGSGIPAVNGTYTLNESCDGVGKYTKDGVYKGQDQTFSLFRCQLSDHTRRWYISIVPKNHVPGTNKDIDFYSAAATGGEAENPPERWTTAKEGRDPAPICTWKHEDDDGEGGSRMWNGDSLEDGDDFQGSNQDSRQLGFL
jgi:ubiquitin carboxyl-terminal hydrolase 9/24